MLSIQGCQSRRLLIPKMCAWPYMSISTLERGAFRFSGSSVPGASLRILPSSSFLKMARADLESSELTSRFPSKSPASPHATIWGNKSSRLFHLVV